MTHQTTHPKSEAFTNTHTQQTSPFNTGIVEERKNKNECVPTATAMESMSMSIDIVLLISHSSSTWLKLIYFSYYEFLIGISKSLSKTMEPKTGEEAKTKPIDKKMSIWTFWIEFTVDRFILLPDNSMIPPTSVYVKPNHNLYSICVYVTHHIHQIFGRV